MPNRKDSSAKNFIPYPIYFDHSSVEHGKKLVIWSIAPIRTVKLSISAKQQGFLIQKSSLLIGKYLDHSSVEQGKK